MPGKSANPQAVATAKSVIPAKAGTHFDFASAWRFKESTSTWVPAFAGMTGASSGIGWSGRQGALSRRRMALKSLDPRFRGDDSTERHESKILVSRLGVELFADAWR
ncbi:hypothetical protein LVB77_16800 [Lysobacter sp. 5GHs7-4]|uniref:hypothetical protein n=1 Tax=Lysobacter sp. 5GHs7-4 TaxID=2904253 RepID=UPI001E63A950|nr:hypothetical protein [Lysobacter sp. 5GHs7-4]UHQ22310.1 hypothetical protein LVB77_16800 [Lysobacter sp. 5GHs7-4]